MTKLNPSVEEQFLQKLLVRGEDECWPWQGSVAVPQGYGRIYPPHAKGKYVYVHHYSYRRTHGPIPQGMHVLHECDNRICGNPKHLFLGTNLDNVRDRQSKGRPGGGRINNLKLTDQQVSDIRADPRHYREVAKDYPVSADYIRQIKKGGKRA